MSDRGLGYGNPIGLSSEAFDKGWERIQKNKLKYEVNKTIYSRGVQREEEEKRNNNSGK